MGQRLGSPIHPPGISQRPGAHSAFQDGARAGTFPKNPVSSLSWVRDWARRSIHQGFHNGPGRSPLFKTERAQGLFHFLTDPSTRDFTAAHGRSPFFKTGHAPGLPAALRSQASQSKFLPVPTPQSLHSETPSSEWRKGR